MSEFDKIRNLISQRTREVNQLKKSISDMKKNTKYSDLYKIQEVKKIDEQLAAVRHKYDTEIPVMIAQLTNELQRGFEEAEYKGLKENATAALLKEMRNQEQARFLAKRYENVPKSLAEEARKLVATNHPSAEAHIKAMYALDIIGADSLEQEYKANNLNDLQKAYQKDLESAQKVKQEYEAAKYEDLDPFKAALAKYVEGN